jgi:hypothetical protein
MRYSKVFLASACVFLSSFAQALHYHSPLKIDNAYIKTKGSVISGNYEGTVSEPAITITTSAPVTIENANLSGPGDLIYAPNANLIVRNTVGVGTNPNIVGQQKGKFLDLSNVISLRVENCYVTGVAFAIFLGGYGGNSTSVDTIKILHNVFHNTDGRGSDGNGGYQVPTGPVNAYTIQMIYLNHVPGMEIAWNEFTNDYVNSNDLGVLQMFDTGGVATSHFLIHDNFIRGSNNSLIAFNSLGSDGVNDVPAFVDIYNNQLVSAANYGVAITTGHDISAYNNRVLSSGYTPQGIFMATPAAAGLLNSNINNEPTTVFYNNNMSNNFSGWLSSASRSDWSLSGQNNAIENNTQSLPVDNMHPAITDEDNEYQIWLQKSGANNRRMGAN